MKKASEKNKRAVFSIGSKDINISNVGDVALRLQEIAISKESRSRLVKNFEYLKERSTKEVIYGLNTGFGPMAHIFISKEKQTELQYNLIRSHAVGLGDFIEPRYVRAIMFIRLQTLLKSHSAVHGDTCRLLVEFLNRNIVPITYQHGSVGASGDLVQLAHIAEALIGEGRVMYQGKIIETQRLFKTVLAKDGIVPLKMHLREGLALINGTSSMTGIAALNVHYSKILLQNSARASSLLFEIVNASEDYFSKEISDVRPHYGQMKVGEFFRSILKSSKRILREGANAANAFAKHPVDSLNKINKDIESTNYDTHHMDRSRQEIYSIRCAIQVLGPILDEIKNATQVVEIEMNSVTDNPLVFIDSKIVHGGNFHGDYISYEMDKLKIAITKLSIFSERKLNFLVNDKVNKILPPFLNTGVVGLDLGLQGLQFVATSTVAENQSLSMPVSIHSISCNNDNQDIVSMGTNSALMAQKVIENTFDVLAIELMSIVRAVQILGIESDLSVGTKAFYESIKRYISGKADLVKRDEVQAIVDFLKNQEVSDFYNTTRK
ncbi:MAG: aromatic amino acid ammonia-lyase [Candidatus Pacebacteria bacterium]|nr:aromatic amino acid ammonia-lyase [Candidatus Paceibacterota bacterium]